MIDYGNPKVRHMMALAFALQPPWPQLVGALILYALGGAVWHALAVSAETSQTPPLNQSPSNR